MAFTDDLSGFTSGDNLTDSADWTFAPGTVIDRFTIGNDGATNYVISSGAGSGADTCPDQGDGDHYAAVKEYDFSISGECYLCVRFVDTSNFVAYRRAGTGAGGRRLSKTISNSRTDLITSQGVSGEWVKVEAEGTTYRLYAGGTGATPSWSQISSDQTVSDGDLSTSETTIAVYSNSGGRNFFTDFEAGALGGGTTVSASPLQNIGRQISPIAASRLGGVLQ